MNVPPRILVLAGAGAALVSAALACTAGDEIAYNDTSNFTGDAAADGEAGVIVDVGDSAPLEVRPPVADGGGVIPTEPTTCLSIATDPEGGDGGCDTNAGRGCCLPADGTPNRCHEQADYYAGGAKCIGPGEVFLTCLGGDPDNICCWQPSPVAGGQGWQTRFRAACDGMGFESCDPNGSDGGPGTCHDGQVCMPKMCKGIMTGACGRQPPCTP